VTADEAEIPGFKREVAVTATVAGLGAIAGAVYSPLDVMEPQLIPEHPLPETLQITTPLSGPLALNCNCAPGFTWAELGVTAICEEEVAATMVAVALDDLLGAATDTAVIVTLGEAGMLAGAVYRPEVEIDPQPDPEQPVPAIDHFTDVFVAPVTLAENCCCLLTLT
jgi:hypothetical protein